MIIKCSKCGKEFSRNPSRIKYKNYCCVECYRQDLLDEYSPFKRHMTKIRHRHKMEKHDHWIDMNVDLKYLKELWDKQKGLCIYTKIPLKLVPNANPKKSIKDLDCATVDRIDSNRGYVRGNIQFCCQFANLGRGNATDERTKEIIRKIWENYNPD